MVTYKKYYELMEKAKAIGIDAYKFIVRECGINGRCYHDSTLSAVLLGLNDSDKDYFDYLYLTEEDLKDGIRVPVHVDELFKKLTNKADCDESEKPDMVNHPSHYQSGRFEVIDIIDEFTKDLKGEMAFDMGNIIKYVLRAGKKNGVEDLKKARWYLDRVIEKWGDFQENR